MRGRVLGGGVATKSRDLGLFIIPEEKSGWLSDQIGQAINRRFHTYVRGLNQGVATPRSDERIDLKIHPRYKNNIARYVRVVRAIPIKESPAEQSLRISLLEQQLLDPINAPTAALRLEAIGKEAIPALVKGIASSDPEVRFYSAEALAYLDDGQAATPLAKAARDEPAFRAFALAALSTIDDMNAHDELVSLLDVPSSETRYGAFRALWAMNANDPLIHGENLGGQFSYHVFATIGQPMIHVTRSYRPEIVLFGNEQTFDTPLLLEAGKSILIKSNGADKVTVSKFIVGQPDQKRVVSTKVDEVIRAIVDLGGTYPDVVQAAATGQDQSRSYRAASKSDALPDSDRAYQHKSEGLAGGDADDRIVVANPMPDMFSSKKRKATR